MFAFCQNVTFPQEDGCILYDTGVRHQQSSRGTSVQRFRLSPPHAAVSKTLWSRQLPGNIQLSRGKLL